MAIIFPRNLFQSRRHIGATSSLELGSVTTNGCAKDIAEMRRQLEDQVTHALAEQGPCALDNPRSAAIVHEAGHVVTFANFGIDVRKCEISPAGGGSDYGQWVGFTSAGKKWRSDGASPPKDDFRQACCAIAGVFAELLFDQKNFRAGSSIDEIAVAQGLASNISHKSGRDYESVLTQIMCATMDILQHHREILRAVARELDLHGVVQGKRLSDILSSLRSHASKFSWAGP